MRKLEITVGPDGKLVIVDPTKVRADSYVGLANTWPPTYEVCNTESAAEKFVTEVGKGGKVYRLVHKRRQDDMSTVSVVVKEVVT